MLGPGKVQANEGTTGKHCNEYTIVDKTETLKGGGDFIETFQVAVHSAVGKLAEWKRLSESIKTLFLSAANISKLLSADSMTTVFS